MNWESCKADLESVCERVLAVARESDCDVVGFRWDDRSLVAGDEAPESRHPAEWLAEIGADLEELGVEEGEDLMLGGASCVEIDRDGSISALAQSLRFWSWLATDQQSSRKLYVVAGRKVDAWVPEADSGEVIICGEVIAAL